MSRFSASKQSQNSQTDPSSAKQFTTSVETKNDDEADHTEDAAPSTNSVDEASDGGAVVDDETFDNIIGAIEVIVSDSKFQQRMNEFLAANAQHFELDDQDENDLGSYNANRILESENKHEHYELYQQYLALGEELVEDELDKQMPDDASLLDFYTTLERMSEEEAADRVPVEIFNLLNTFLSFEAFREQMIDYKRASQARIWRDEQPGQVNGLELSSSASSTAVRGQPLSVVASREEQRERRQRQDAAVTVEDLIQISSYK